MAFYRGLVLLISLVYGITMGNVIEPPMQGINLGGWFILEKFITPSIFASVNDSRVRSEWDLVGYHRNISVEILSNHWDSWVQEEDIRKLSEIGFTHVRLPIGYWAMLTQDELDQRGEHYITGQWPYLLRCLGWLKKYGIKAIIDLHGAPGSQNGWDNSGQYIDFSQMVGWGQGDTVQRTLDIIDTLSSWIAGLDQDNSTNGTVAGLELMNEAFPWRILGQLGTIQDYYTRAYSVARNHLDPKRYAVVIEEAFSPFSWKNFMDGGLFQNVILDIHIYQCFDPNVRAASYQEHLNLTCQVLVDQVLTQTLPTMVGEWSVAFKVESAFADTEPYPSPADVSFMREYALSQIKTYGSNFFWNFKTESAPMWDYFLGVNGTWLPSLLPPNTTTVCLN